MIDMTVKVCCFTSNSCRHMYRDWA